MGMLLYMEEQKRLAALKQKEAESVEEIPFTDPEEPVEEAEVTAEQEKPAKPVTRRQPVKKSTTTATRRRRAK